MTLIYSLGFLVLCCHQQHVASLSVPRLPAVLDPFGLGDRVISKVTSLPSIFGKPFNRDTPIHELFDKLGIPVLPVGLKPTDFLEAVNPAELLIFLTEVPDPSVFINADATYLQSLSKPWQRFFFGIRTWVENKWSWKMNKLRSGAACFSCNIAATLITVYVKLGFPASVIEGATIGICTGLGLYSHTACSGTIRNFMPEIEYIVKHKTVNPYIFCGMVLQDYNCNRGVHIWPPLQWDVDVNVGEPAETRPLRGNGRYGVKKVLQLADVHYDPAYRVGYSKTCKEPICCRTTNGPTSDVKQQAGYWGEYAKCDMPYHSIENMLHHIQQHHNIDLVIISGDLPPHDVWETSKEQSLFVLGNLSSTVEWYFQRVPIVPVVGNHESHPTNSFPQTAFQHKRFDVTWLYNGLASAWSRWLPTNALSNVRRTGCYSHSPLPGLRVLSINTNMCYTLNFWLLYDSRDPERVLEWLAKELLKAERHGESVYLIGHVPPGNPDCWSVWSEQYAEMVKRFQHIVKGQFYSHSHYDEFKVFTDKKRQPYSVMYLGGSVTTFENLNPSYRIYTVDSVTYDILDFETWSYNLTEANEGHGVNSPNWYKVYSPRSEFRLRDLSPSEWHRFARRMWKDDTAFNKYRRVYWRDSTPALNEACDYTCKQTMLCNAHRKNWADYLAECV